MALAGTSQKNYAAAVRGHKHKGVKLSKDELQQLGRAGKHHHWVKVLDENTGKYYYIQKHDKGASLFSHLVNPVQHLHDVSRVVHSKKFKNIVRKVQGRIENVAGFALEAAGTVFLGAIGGAAATAIAAPLEYHAGAMLARSRGHGGRAARKAGRRTMKQALIVGGALTGGAMIAGVASGAGIFASGISSVSSIVGGGGAEAAAGGAATNIAASTAGTTAAQSSIPGLVTSADLAASTGATAGGTVAAAAAAAPVAASSGIGVGTVAATAGTGVLWAISSILGHGAGGGTSVSVGGGGQDLGGLLGGLLNQGVNTGQDYLNGLLGGGQQQQQAAGGIPTWVWIGGGLAAAYFLTK